MEEKLVGSAEVKAIFDLGKSGKVIGCYVQMGVITRGYQIKILRSNKEFVAQTKIISIRKQKDDVKEVSNSHECGIAIDKSIDVKIGDILECYQITEKKRHID